MNAGGWNSYSNFYVLFLVSPIKRVRAAISTSGNMTTKFLKYDFGSVTNKQNLSIYFKQTSTLCSMPANSAQLGLYFDPLFWRNKFLWVTRKSSVRCWNENVGKRRKGKKLSSLYLLFNSRIFDYLTWVATHWNLSFLEDSLWISKLESESIKVKLIFAVSKMLVTNI